MADSTSQASISPVRQRVHFHGRVQGVGFRYTTASIAKRHPVVGYVKNLNDGSVELVAEAEREVLKQFLADIAAAFAANIRQQNLDEIPREEPFTKFEIRR